MTLRSIAICYYSQSKLSKLAVTPELNGWLAKLFEYFDPFDFLKNQTECIN